MYQVTLTFLVGNLGRLSASSRSVRPVLSLSLCAVGASGKNDSVKDCCLLAGRPIVFHGRLRRAASCGAQCRFCRDARRPGIYDALLVLTEDGLRPNSWQRGHRRVRGLYFGSNKLGVRRFLGYD